MACAPVPVSPQEALAGFSSMITSYEHRIGHVCRAIASRLPGLLKSFPPNGKFLDNACGTGAATEELLKAHSDAQVFASDAVPLMVESFRVRMAASPLLSSAQVRDLRVEDGQALTYPDGVFDVSITNFGIFFFQDPLLGAQQIYRTLKPGGTALVTVWKTFGFKPILWEVQDRIRPADPLLELPLVEPWCNPEKLEGILKGGGFQKVEFHVLEESMWGKDKEDFKLVLHQNFSAMVSRNWTDDETAKLASATSQLVDDVEMQEKFCIRDGEKIGCTMEAWAAVCTR